MQLKQATQDGYIVELPPPQDLLLRALKNSTEDTKFVVTSTNDYAVVVRTSLECKIHAQVCLIDYNPPFGTWGWTSKNGFCEGNAAAALKYLLEEVTK